MLRRAESSLRTEVETLERRLGRALREAETDPSGAMVDAVHEIDSLLLWRSRQLETLWEPPQKGTMGFHEAMCALQRVGSRHRARYDGLLWVELSPETLKTIQRPVPEMRALVYLRWRDRMDVDTMEVWDPDATELLGRIVVPGADLELSAEEREVYTRLRLDGLAPDDAVSAARLLTPRR